MSASDLPANGSPAVAGEPQVPAEIERVRLERKHPLAIRWMHWINFPVLFTMIWSGLLIYWNDSDNAYRYPHRCTASASASSRYSAFSRTGSIKSSVCLTT